jgi:hypothetical protein
MSTVSDGSLFSLHGRSARAQRFLARFSSATYIALGLIAALSGDRTTAARTA